MKKIFLISSTMALLFVNSYCCATNTGADFLKIGIGARPVGLGNAFTAIANDVTAINWNPGGLSQLNQKEVSAMHSQWIADTNLDFIGFAVPLFPNPYPLFPVVFGGSIIVLSQGELEGRDENRVQTGGFSASDLAVTLSVSKQVSKLTSMGINLKIIQQRIESEQATGVAFDVGSLYHFATLPLSFGLSLQNLGPQMKFISEPYNLPLSVTAGLGYNIGAVTLGLDIKQQVYEGKTIVSIGTEFLPINALALRAGYLLPAITQSTLNKTDLNTYSGFGGGIGITLFGTNTDYSFVPYGILGDTHRISFSTKF
ncbi:MAG: hypothetical protein A2252_11870 [Elusimicrobia bacterium RIFOXYA2_FULL_39_19]|nr:MAG: hypothetical protein A2252_11870 [Elusimicrobia bacterium RIFOXYA2_FULL_39_19]